MREAKRSWVLSSWLYGKAVAAAAAPNQTKTSILKDRTKVKGEHRSTGMMDAIQPQALLLHDEEVGHCKRSN